MKHLKLFTACSQAVFAIAKVVEDDILQGRERQLKRAEGKGGWRGCEETERVLKRLKLFTACSQAAFDIAKVAEDEILQGRERQLNRAERKGWWRGWEDAMSLLEEKEKDAYNNGFVVGASEGFLAGKASRKWAAKRGDTGGGAAGGGEAGGGTGGGASAAPPLEEEVKQLKEQEVKQVEEQLEKTEEENQERPA